MTDQLAVHLSKDTLPIGHTALDASPVDDRDAFEPVDLAQSYTEQVGKKPYSLGTTKQNHFKVVSKERSRPRNFQIAAVIANTADQAKACLISFAIHRQVELV